jgi:hypothetical protein
VDAAKSFIDGIAVGVADDFSGNRVSGETLDIEPPTGEGATLSGGQPCDTEFPRAVAKQTVVVGEIDTSIL